MSYRIIADSSCDKSAVMANWNNITFVPLTLQIGDYKIFDDENFDQTDFLNRVREYDGVVKTACPAPAQWSEAYDCEEDDIYVITITDKLSGTYNSALQGVELYMEDHPDSNKKIHVFNSLATAGTLTLIAERIHKLGEEGKSFDEIVEDVEDFILNGVELNWVLESLDVLKQNGRLFAVAASILKKLKLKMIFKAVDGNLSYISQDLSMNRALIKMSGYIANNVEGKDLSDKRLVISHVNALERAQLVADKVKAANANFGDVEIVECSGLNTTYASEGSILAAYTK